MLDHAGIPLKSQIGCGFIKGDTHETQLDTIQIGFIQQSVSGTHVISRCCWPFDPEEYLASDTSFQCGLQC